MAATSSTPRIKPHTSSGLGAWTSPIVGARHIFVAILFCGSTAWSQPATAPATGGAGPETFVRPVALQRLQAAYEGLTGRSRELVDLYMAAAREVLAETDGCYPHAGSMLYRNYAERAKGAAILSAIRGRWPEELRLRCRSEAARLVAEVARAHAREASFGDAWQAPLHVAEAGMAAWFVWENLDPEAQGAVARMIVYEADRLAAVKPQTAYRGDTQAETVAWNSALLGVAVNMMPHHPNAPTWEAALKLYLYNTLAAPQDVHDASPGDDGRPVSEWILGANVHEDFALENHNQFHIEYVLACYRFHLLVASCYQAAGRPLPKAIQHHARDMYEKVLLRCMNRDGFFVFVPDNDWRRYHVWTESATVHCYLAFLERLPLASALESRALHTATGYWRESPADWSYDNPYVCGKPWTPRIAEAVLLHLTASERMPAPLPDEQVNAGLVGIGELKSVRLLTQHSAAGSFRSFYAGPGRSPVRFIAPARNSWMLLPVGTNYTGPVSAQPPGESGEIHSEHGTDWFWVVRTSSKGGEAFISLPDEIVVYLELQAGGDEAGRTIERTIAVEKPHRPIRVWFDDGEAAWEPGRTAWHRADAPLDPVVPGNWVNLDDAIGYVAVNAAADARATWVLPEPTKRSALKRQVAFGESAPVVDGLVIFPGQTHPGTARAAKQVRLAVVGGAAGVAVGEWVVWVNLTDGPATLDTAESGTFARPSQLPPRTAWAMRAGRPLF